jgi:hypothetical protein
LCTCITNALKFFTPLFSLWVLESCTRIYHISYIKVYTILTIFLTLYLSGKQLPEENTGSRISIYQHKFQSVQIATMHKIPSILTFEMIAISALSFERHMLPRMLASPFSLKTLLILALNIIGVLSVSFYGLVFSKLFSLFSFFCTVFFAIISILIACVCVCTLNILPILLTLNIEREKELKVRQC